MIESTIYLKYKYIESNNKPLSVSSGNLQNSNVGDFSIVGYT